MASRDGSWIADFLVGYLSTSVDPYDFSFLIETWGLKTKRGRLENDFEALDEKDQAAFTGWLSADHRKNAHRAMEGTAEIPAYLLFEDPKRLPKGSWLLHFTDATPFREFDRGSLLETLALSAHIKKKTPVKCPINLWDTKTGPGEVVFGFGFVVLPNGKLKGENFGSVVRKYGKNAVLFRSDVAVEAYHASDDEHQAIFPLCSEYDAVPLWNVTSAGGGETEVGGRGATFDTLAELVAFAERSGGRAAGMARGTTKARSRWNPGFAPPEQQSVDEDRTEANIRDALKHASELYSWRFGEKVTSDRAAFDATPVKRVDTAKAYAVLAREDMSGWPKLADMRGLDERAQLRALTKFRDSEWARMMMPWVRAGGVPDEHPVVIVDAGRRGAVIGDGRGRIALARAMGWTTLPVVVLRSKRNR